MYNERIILFRPVTDFFPAYKASNIVPVLPARVEVKASLCEGLWSSLESRRMRPFNRSRSSQSRIFDAFSLCKRVESILITFHCNESSATTEIAFTLNDSQSHASPGCLIYNVDLLCACSTYSQTLYLNMIQYGRKASKRQNVDRESANRPRKRPKTVVEVVKPQSTNSPLTGKQRAVDGMFHLSSSLLRGILIGSKPDAVSSSKTTPVSRHGSARRKSESDPTTDTDEPGPSRSEFCLLI